MSITAKDIQELRKKTGVGMMDAKKALIKAEGDFEKAILNLREQGLAAATKKADRIAAEGTVLIHDTDDSAVLLEVNAETDFVAKNEKFQKLALDVAKTIAAHKPADIDALNELKIVDGDTTVAEEVQNQILSIGENIRIRRFEIVNGKTAAYIHGGGTVGVVISFETNVDKNNEKLQAMGRDVAMQVAAMNPSYLDKDSVPAEVLESEKSILKTQLEKEEAEKPENKRRPAEILERIVAGKLGKYYEENCLMQQIFVKDNALTVEKYVDSVAKELGEAIKVTGFIRYEKGEGLEKREDNFAQEIAEMM